MARKLQENDVLFAHKALNLVSGLSEAGRRVAGAILDHFNKKTGRCDPSVERLAAMLGVDRATVLRATDRLHKLGLIEKISHGGNAHCASYAPNWDVFRAIVEDWDARMKTGGGPSGSSETSSADDSNVAALRPSESQDCDVKGRKIATQTLRSNPSKKPFELEQVETQLETHVGQRLQNPQQGLRIGRKPTAQRSILLPINGGRNFSHEEAAHAAAARRWNLAAQALGEGAYAEVIEWMTLDRQEAATQAEVARRGGGITFIVAEMRAERVRSCG